MVSRLFQLRVRSAALDKDLRRGLEKCLSGKQERFARLAAALDAMSSESAGAGYVHRQKGEWRGDLLGPERSEWGAFFPEAVRWKFEMYCGRDGTGGALK